MTSKPFHNPFAPLEALRDQLPQVHLPEPAPTPGAAQTARSYPRAVVRVERAGRRGKAATVVEQLELTAAEREAWLAELKSALGCGGSIEGESLMLQGDQRRRLPSILAARGVRKIIVS